MQSRHQTLTLGVLVALCLFAVFFGVRAVTSPVPEQDLVSDEEPVCENRDIKAGTQVGPQEVTVSVYNASGRAGKASQTMKALLEKGFSGGDSGNVDAPQVKWVQVWADSVDNPAARLVARQFGKGVKIKAVDDLPGIGVVVVVGPGLEGVAEDAPDTIKAKVDGSFCSPPVT